MKTRYRVIVMALAVILVFLHTTAFAQIYVERCANYYNAGDYKRAIEEGKKAVKLYPKNFYAHFCLGMSYLKVGELDLALSNMKNAEKLAISKEDLPAVYNLLGLIYSNKGDLDNALFYYSKHLSLSRELGDKRGEASALNNIAGVYRSKGDLDKALDYLEQSLRLKTDEKDKVTTLNNIATIYTDKGNFTKAVEYFKKSIEISERVGDYHGGGQTMLNLGDTYRQMKDFENAWYYLNEGLKRVTKVGDKYWETYAYLYFGHYYRDTGDKKKAKEYYEKSLELAKAIGSDKLASHTIDALNKLESQKKTK